MRLDRAVKVEEVLVSVICCNTAPELNDTALACRTVDVSEAGMQLASRLTLPVCSKLGLRLDLSSRLYRLEGEVRWARDEDTHYLGLLLDDESPDYEPWTKVFTPEFFSSVPLARASA